MHIDGDDLVVLVDEMDNQVGVMDKSRVHHKNTPLHRAFSVFIYRPSPKASERQVLVQRRALSKKTWPGVWSNSCCGHPLPGESYEAAVKRRGRYELGVEIKDLKKVADYRYRFERDGVVENEICPVFVAKIVGGVKPNFDEVEEIKWVGWEEFLNELKTDKTNKWSEWCKEEVKLIITRA